MLNRRILRVKAMQALYGYFTTVESLKEVSRESLKEKHSLDPAKHDFSDKALFEERKKLAVRLFNQNFSNKEVETSEDIEKDVLEAVNAEIAEFQKRRIAESRIRKSEMLKDANKIFDLYVKFLMLPIEIEHREKQDSEKKKAAGRSFPFIGDHIIQKLKESEDLSKAVEKSSASWGNELTEIKSWYRNEIMSAEVLEPYFDKKSDRDSLVQDLFKKVIFKNENIVAYLESYNLHWPENQPIVKSMVIKTIKNLEEGGPFELAELTKNGKEDFDFFETLYDGVLRENDFLDEQIATKTKNWDVDRIALTDRVILKIALVEMMNCPSIPTKVSINEAIEISKLYSTPKSKQFVNGVLDVLSNELTSTGKVRKSGRGLIDNR